MSDLYTRFASGVLFPLHEWAKGHRSVAVRRALERTQWLPPHELGEYQRQRLAAFIRASYTRVPYVRRLFDTHGLTPADVQDVDGLRRLPLMDKAIIRANTDALKARDAQGLARFNTGGSSGEPLVFYIGKERVSHDVAAKWRATRWWDVDIGDREIVVWGSPIELGAQDRVRMLRDGLLRSRLLPAFDLSAANLHRFIAEIRRFRPRMLFGYPSSLALMAAHAQAKGINLDDLGVRVAFVTSERLYDHQRDIITRVFGCPVANGYGGRDAGFIAHACPKGRLHITAEDLIVEILDRDGQPVTGGACGEIVITHLATADFPFIRYRTGDVGALDAEPCPCGRSLPVLARIEGRTTDFVVAADGTVMHGLALIYILRDLEGIDQFQILQESLARTRVLVTTATPLAPGVIAEITTRFRQRLGATVEISVEQVPVIPRAPSGKYRYVQSRVPLTPSGLGLPGIESD
ncbi:MAG: phenylacetate--CoA ligase family protein [Thiohalocapsa sp.]|jgi:phenylacetate-CoA ligase|uniref:phenylacetate--CoA ligase family protein n=1 Tax=Thiohalocapsa sp. TaxID=2497641 RepID=UPI0025E981AD|nr:phenylacetate--CoA ligase family protein [Thiohalocapsa sp.]MCG6940123.1 phenylacetate--CoA ligase family protein [Thiohalocapsa sp.]